ncbi:MAG: VIT family protein [Gammaproteobacteria bacterium]|jgi:VIT1/CCC1 family predicted Fe2+/Mn2+ transporter
MHRKKHAEHHYMHRIGWLRAAVLGANDGIVSTASLVVGVAAANVARGELLIASIAGMVAGAMSMAAGEYVSVSSQADTEKADLEREKKELKVNEPRERQELTEIYMERGLDKDLASEVARQLMEHDALGAHARDELGLSEPQKARPIQAAVASAASFSVGAALPVLLAAVVPMNYMIIIVAIASLLFLGTLGAVAARAGGSSMLIGTVRVTFWGALAMLVTAIVGHFFGAVV